MRTPPSDHCAMAQDGAIEAWAMKGRVYVRRTVRATRPGAAASRVLLGVVSTGWLLIQDGRSPSSGRASPGCQVAEAARAFSPAVAASSVSATTPAKLPSRATATTPGTALALVSSSAASVAPGDGGRKT